MEYVERAEDQHIRGELVYIKQVADGHVYSDPECTIKLNAAQLKHLFAMNRAVIVSGTNKIRPFVLTTYENRSYVSLSYVVSGVDDEATIVTVYSSEYAVTEADIKSFAIATGETAVINSTARTIAITMPLGTTVTALKPTFTISDYATIKVGATSQVSGVTANDFTNPVTYSVTAEDGVTVKEWVVTVTVATE